MPTYNFLDPETEDRLFTEIEQRNSQYNAYRRTVSRDMADRVSGIADAYSWLDPGVTQALAQAGLGASDPAVEQIATTAAEIGMEDGAFEEPMADVPDNMLEAAWEAVSKPVATGIKAVARSAFTVLAAPYEELSRFVDALGEATFDDDSQPFWNDFVNNYTNLAAPSNLALAIGDVAAGRPIGLGEGFLPDYQRRETMARRLTLDGYHVTPGRLVSRLVTEPGTKPYSFISGAVDAALNLAIPVDLGAGKLAKVAGVGRVTDALADSMGLARGIRRTVIQPDITESVLASPRGRQLVQWFTDTTDVREIFENTGRADWNAATRLAASRSADETVGILRETLGSSFRELPSVGAPSQIVGTVTGAAAGLVRPRTFGGVAGGANFGSLFGASGIAKRASTNVRLAGQVPGRFINPWDMDDTAGQLIDFMRNADLDSATISARLGDLTGVAEGDLSGVLRVVESATEDIVTKLVNQEGRLAKKFTRGEARELTRLWRSTVEESSVYSIDDIGRNMDVLGARFMLADGTVDLRPTVHITSELLQSQIPLPDAREIKRATSAIGRLWDIPGVKGVLAGTDFVMGNLWKPLQLFRFAYTARVMAEEQIRLAAAGYDSMFTHPFSYIAATFGSRRSVDAFGSVFEGQSWYKSAMSRGTAAWHGLPAEIVTGRFVKSPKLDSFGDVIPTSVRGWAYEIRQLSDAPEVQKIASNWDNLDSVKGWWWDGAGAQFRRQLGGIPGKEALLSSRQAADEYIDGIQRLINVKTGQNPELLDAIATSRLRDLDLHSAGAGVDRKLASLLERDFIDSMPGYVKVPDTIAAASEWTSMGAKWDNATNAVFRVLNSGPTNKLHRSPVFRQAYWKRMEELLPYATREVGEQALSGAKLSKLSGREMDNLAAKITDGDRIIDMVELDGLAKAFALDEVKGLLYDVSRRSQFFDAARLAFPFGEAYKEVMGTWIKLISDNPRILRRGEQVWKGATDDTAGEFFHNALGTGGQSGEGILYPDPNTGDMVFAFPGSELISKAVLGTNKAQVRLTGRAAGLNIISTTMLPGFGPMVQVPASVMLPDSSSLDVVRNILLPFGETDLDNGVLESQLPAWIRKIVTAMKDNPDADRLYGNSMKDVMNALARTGEYEIGTREGQQKLLEDAQERTKALWLIRGVAQMAAPTGPAFQWDTTDVEGNMVPVKVMSDAYRLILDEYSGDRGAANTEFVRRFGTDNLLALQGKSRSITPRPVTKLAADWLDERPELKKNYPITAGLFAPDTPNDEFDYNAYNASFNEKARQQLTPAQMLALSNQYQGNILYQEMKKKVAGRTDAEAMQWLATMRLAIAQQYEGFDDYIVGIVERPRTEDVIEELERAVNDPLVANTDAAVASRAYFQARAAATRIAESMGYKSFAKAKEMYGTRELLRTTAAELMERYPGFAQTWYFVFERELADDLSPVTQ